MKPQQILSHHGKSFALGARFLSKTTRHDVTLLYAFARVADDLADEEHLGSLPERMAQLQAMQRDALQPDAQSTELAHEVGRMLARCGAQSEVLAHFLISLQQDSGSRHLQTEQELMQFAHGVAGTVGQLLCPLLGAPQDAQRYALALGMAMQFTNIARDVVEDAARGRCYIPAQWGLSLQELSAPASLAQKAASFAAITRLLSLADEFYTFATLGFAQIPQRNRRAIVVASSLYRAIGQKIVQRGAAQYWQGRCSLNAWEKCVVVARNFKSSGQVAESTHALPQSTLQHLQQMPGFPV
jgi:15-cis-phytoene synthase